MTEADLAALRATVDVSRETARRLAIFLDELRRWSGALNLVSRGTLDDAWARHVLDSARLWPLAPTGVRSWVDLGSGAGFPGLVIAAIAAELRPSLAVTLVESDARKCAFLAAAARAMGLAPRIRNRRIEAPAEPADVVSARALAPLPRLFALAEPWLAPGGVGLFPKGADHARELTEAARHWHSRIDVAPGLPGTQGVVLRVTELRRVQV